MVTRAEGDHPLGLDQNGLSACVACGLCLPHCPTFRVSGDETRSPRGRIAAMRAVEWQGAAIDASFLRVVDECVQCRGCEPACPSAVPFGRLMEDTRAALAATTAYQPAWKRAGYAVLGHRRLLRAGSVGIGIAQRLGLVPRRFRGNLARSIPLRQRPLVETGDDVYLFTGCVMDSWMRDTHLAAQRVLEATGFGVAFAQKGGNCCGALHVHAGLRSQAAALARKVMASLPGEQPIVVDSAGCGAALKDYGHLLDTPEAHVFAARVLDVHEVLAQHADRLPLPRPGHMRRTVAIQDPCHLRHVQRVHAAVRVVLAPYVELVELDDDGLCCGAGGAYAAQHRGLATDIRARKVEAVERTGVRVVASANPGCAMWLADAGLDVHHPLELVAEALA